MRLENLKTPFHLLSPLEQENILIPIRERREAPPPRKASLLKEPKPKKKKTKANPLKAYMLELKAKGLSKDQIQEELLKKLGM